MFKYLRKDESKKSSESQESESKSSSPDKEKQSSSPDDNKSKDSSTPTSSPSTDSTDKKVVDQASENVIQAEAVVMAKAKSESEKVIEEVVVKDNDNGKADSKETPSSSSSAKVVPSSIPAAGINKNTPNSINESMLKALKTAVSEQPVLGGLTPDEVFTLSSRIDTPSLSTLFSLVDYFPTMYSPSRIVGEIIDDISTTHSGLTFSEYETMCQNTFSVGLNILRVAYKPDPKLSMVGDASIMKKLMEDDEYISGRWILGSVDPDHAQDGLRLWRSMCMLTMMVAQSYRAIVHKPKQQTFVRPASDAINQWLERRNVGISGNPHPTFAKVGPKIPPWFSQEIRDIEQELIDFGVLSAATVPGETNFPSSATFNGKVFSQFCCGTDSAAATLMALTYDEMYDKRVRMDEYTRMVQYMFPQTVVGPGETQFDEECIHAMIDAEDGHRFKLSLFKFSGLRDELIEHFSSHYRIYYDALYKVEDRSSQVRKYSVDEPNMILGANYSTQLFDRLPAITKESHYKCLVADMYADFFDVEFTDIGLIENFHPSLIRVFDCLLLYLEFPNLVYKGISSFTAALWQALHGLIPREMSQFITRYGYFRDTNPYDEVQLARNAPVPPIYCRVKQHSVNELRQGIVYMLWAVRPNQYQNVFPYLYRIMNIFHNMVNVLQMPFVDYQVRCSISLSRTKNLPTLNTLPQDQFYSTAYNAISSFISLAMDRRFISNALNASSMNVSSIMNTWKPLDLAAREFCLRMQGNDTMMRRWMISSPYFVAGPTSELNRINTRVGVIGYNDGTLDPMFRYSASYWYEIPLRLHISSSRSSFFTMRTSTPNPDPASPPIKGIKTLVLPPFDAVSELKKFEALVMKGSELYKLDQMCRAIADLQDDLPAGLQPFRDQNFFHNDKAGFYVGLCSKIFALFNVDYQAIVANPDRHGSKDYRSVSQTLTPLGSTYEVVPDDPRLPPDCAYGALRELNDMFLRRRMDAASMILFHQNNPVFPRINNIWFYRTTEPFIDPTRPPPQIPGMVNVTVRQLETVLVENARHANVFVLKYNGVIYHNPKEYPLLRIDIGRDFNWIKQAQKGLMGILQRGYNDRKFMIGSSRTTYLVNVEYGYFSEEFLSKYHDKAFEDFMSGDFLTVHELTLYNTSHQETLSKYALDETYELPSCIFIENFSVSDIIVTNILRSVRTINHLPLQYDYFIPGNIRGNSYIPLDRNTNAPMYTTGNMSLWSILPVFSSRAQFRPPIITLSNPDPAERVEYYV